jgi:hypothetical protein
VELPVAPIEPVQPPAAAASETQTKLLQKPRPYGFLPIASEVAND